MNEESNLIHIECPGGIRANLDPTAKELAELEKQSRKIVI